MASEDDYFSPKADQNTDTNNSRPRRINTTSSLRTPNLRHRPSNQSRLGSAREASRLESIESARTRRSYNGSQRGHTSGAECTVQQSDAEHARQNARQLKRQQTDKKPDERFYVDNDYYSLNPWYENQPSRPLFGLSRPFPRTVRPGMLWGRKGTHKNQGEQATDNRPNVGPSIQMLDDEGQDPGPPPDVFITDINGYEVEVRRVSPQEADEEEDQGIERHDHYNSEQGHDGLESTESDLQKKQAYPGGLSPLKEDDSASVETTQTQEEKQEVHDREEQALHEFYNNYRNPLARLRARYPEAPAEFLATMVYVFFGITGSLYSITYPADKGDYQTQSWAWGFAVTAGIYIGGGVSGAHMNPWISVCFSVYRGFPWKMCLVYAAAQMLAGFVAGALAWGIYRDAIYHTDPKLTPDVTGLAFYSLPQTYVSTSTAFFNNFLSSALYVCIAFALGDDSNTPPGAGMSALIYGFMTYLLSITMGYNGLGISPARDLGPRCVAWWVGYGRDTFATGWWAYGPIAAGLTGSLAGALLYDIFIFAGGESPVNYTWPGPGDIKQRLRARRDQAKEYVGKLPV